VPAHLLTYCGIAMNESLRILLVTQHAEREQQLRALLQGDAEVDLRVSLPGDEALQREDSGETGIVLMSWPNGTSLQALGIQARMQPVILLIESGGETGSLPAIECGVQDCIPVVELGRERLLHTVRKVQARWRHMEALRTSENRYRMLFERNLAGVYRCTLDGRIVDANGALARMLGYESGEDLQRHTAWEFYFDPAERKASLAHLNGQASVTNSVLRLRRRDGNAIWVLESMTLLASEPGVPPLIEGTMIEITERKKLEEALASEQTLLHTLMEYLPDSIYFKDLESRFIRASRACARKLGCDDSASIIGKSDFDFFAAEHAGEAFADEQEMIRTGKGMIGKEEMETWTDGRVAWASTTKMPMRDAQGRICGTFGVSRDITSIKNDQARIEHLMGQNEMLLNAVGEAICGLDLDGNVTFANPMAARLTGWTVPELIGKRLHDLVHQKATDECAAGTCPLQDALMDRNRRQQEDTFVRRDGATIPVEFIANAVIEPSGEQAGAVLAFRDISERREIARMKDEFVAVVSHELRTPLTSIRGALGLLASGHLGTLPEKGQQMLQIAVSNANRLVRLINDILDLERIESAHAETEWASCELGDILQQCVDLMRPVAERARIELQIEAEAVTFQADGDRLQRAISNLISNAIKFSPPDSVVTLAGGTRDNAVWIDVRDQGRGIPLEHLERIFERFHQVDKSDSRDKGGTGLGLPICRKIVEQQGGSIWAESEEGLGSTFHILLPQAQKPGESETARKPATEVRAMPPMLVCSELPDQREAVAQQMTRAGYRVLLAASMDEAIRHAEQEKPGALLMGSPMGGQKVWSEILNLRDHLRLKDVPILVLGLPAPADGGHAGKDAGDPLSEEGCSRTSGETGKICRILLVEDDRDQADVLMEMFHQHQIETVHACSGREAIEIASAVRPDLVVLDVGLPEGDGFYVVRGLHQDACLRTVPLVVYSGRNLNAAERHQLRLGPTEYLTKGEIEPEEFERHVLNLLTHWMV
jgi:PAS domain S-box-containing protein